MDEATLKRIIREVIAERDTARMIFTGHNIMKDVTAEDPETAPRVTPSRVIEVGAQAALDKPVT